MYASFADEINGLVGFAGYDDCIIRIFDLNSEKIVMKIGDSYSKGII